MICHRFQKNRKKIFFGALIGLFLFSANLLYDSIPNECYIPRGEEETLHFSLPVTLEKKESSVTVFQNTNNKMNIADEEETYQLTCKFLNLIPVKEVSVHVVEKSKVIPAGMPVGIYTKTKGILVLGTGKVTASDGLNYEPADTLVQSGDYILSINGAEVSKKKELVNRINDSNGEPLVLGILREGKEISLQIKPVLLEDGSYKIGIWVRDDMAGVGTLTYVERDMTYGALGHPVSDADTGSNIELQEGKVYSTDIVGIVKGKDGEPGELTGVINYSKDYCLGSIEKNTITGIYGNLTKLPYTMEQNYMDVAMKQDIQMGEAYILSALDGTLRRYAIEIDEIDFNNKEKNKGLLFHVTDPKLLDKTGGIVQGMSGSPILQDGKIVGAVTHVLVNDPTRGYGIFIENMLEH